MTSRNVNKLSISQIRHNIDKAIYLSDDLVILFIDNMMAPLCPTLIDGFIALVMMQGTARVSIGTEQYDLKPNTLLYVHDESIVKTVECSEDARAYVVAFSQKFISNVPVDVATSLPVYMRLGKWPCMELSDNDISELRQLFLLIKTMLESDKNKYKSDIIHTLFTTVFYILSDIDQRNVEEERMRHGRCGLIFERFMSLLKTYHKSERSVGFYAREMNITPKYLSSVVKEVSGKTAARWIDEYVILEAKTLLKYSSMSIQEIAYALNFSSQSFFGKYFKQHTGSSPSRFKRKG